MAAKVPFRRFRSHIKATGFATESAAGTIASIQVNRTTTLAANTALTGVLIGTPVTTAVAADSHIVSNIVASGDIMVAANRGGNSEEYLFVDSSAGQLKLKSPADHMLLSTALLNKTIRLNNITDSTTASGDLIGFQSKPRTGVAGTQSVYGCQISAQISDGIALTGSGSIVGGHIDVYVRGTAAGTIAGDVRGLQIELTTDDAGTRNISGYVTALRIRKAFSAGTVTGVQSAIRVEVPETQTNSETYTGLFDLTGTIGSGTTAVWLDTGVTSATAAGVLGLYVNGNKRYINLFSGTPA